MKKFSKFSEVHNYTEMQALTCFVCHQRVPGALNGLSHHLIYIHGLALKHKISDVGFRCGQDGCQRRFCYFYTLRNHIRQCHLNNNNHNNNDNNNNNNNNEDEEGPENNEANDYEVHPQIIHMDDQDQHVEEPHIEDNYANEDFDLRKYVVRMIARFNCKPSITSTLLCEILEECEQLLLQVGGHLKHNVEQLFNTRGLNDDEAKNVLKKFDFDSPFDGLKSLDGQIESLKSFSHYVEPIEVPLGYRMDSALDRNSGVYMPKQVLETFQYVPVIPTLSLILSSPEIQESVEFEKKSPAGILASFLDGDFVKNHPLFSRFPHALRLQVYYDELETTNPLGSKTGVHKLGLFYYTIQNLPPQINSELSSIHVLAMCTDADAKKYGFQKILAPFLEELRLLESDTGILIETTRGNYVLRASIAAFCGDGLAVHDVFNFLSPSSNYFCRMCMYSRHDLHNGTILPTQKRTREHYDQQIAFLKQNNFSAGSKTETGLRGECYLHESKYFHITNNKVFDIMHDLLCGICPMVLKLVLNEFILIQKKFNCSYFNGKIMSFQYGFVEITNKPSANFTDGILRRNEHTLSQKAMQIWCLIRAFPFLVADKIPPGDQHLALVLNLLRIMEIVFAPRINDCYLRYLENLISAFQTNFRLLFPNVNPINKFHHLEHYVECIKWMGPLINHWCMRYEAKHGNIRLRAQNVHNFKNLPKTLIRLCQCEQSAKWGSKDVKINKLATTNKKIIAVQDTVSSEALFALDYIGIDEVYYCNSAKVNGVEFRVGLYVCLETSSIREDNLPLFGYIREIIILRDTDVYLFTSACTTIEFEANLNAYHIKLSDDDDCSGHFINTQDLPYFKPFCSWTPSDSNQQIDGPTFLDLEEKDLIQLKLKMGPRKRILKYIELINPKNTLNTSFIVQDNGILTIADENYSGKFPTFIQGHPLSISNTSSNNDQPSTSFDVGSNVSNLGSNVSKSPQTFSRYGTVKATLLQHPQGPGILKSTKTSWSEENRRALVRIMVAELIKCHDYYPPNESKIALAKAIITEFPSLKDKKRDLGYEHFYNECKANNRGFIENRLAQSRKPLSPSKKKYKISKKTSNVDNKNKGTANSSENQYPEEEILEMISSMKLKIPNDKNKKQIISWLNDTRSYRRNWINADNPCIGDIFKMYPRLQDYNGEMIDLEFENLFPEAADKFVSKFPTTYTEKILAYAKKYRPALYLESRSIKNNDFRALLLLVELLPVSNSVKTPKGKGNGKGKGKGIKRLADGKKEEDQPLLIDFPNKELLRIAPDGTNLEQFANDVRNNNNNNKKSVQPYLITAASQSSAESTFINGDGWFINVPDKGNSVTSFDLLYKIFYVFNLEYPDSLRNFYNFLDFYICEMGVKPYSIVSSVHVNITNINLQDFESDDDNTSSD